MLYIINCSKFILQASCTRNLTVKKSIKTYIILIFDYYVYKI